MNWSNPKEANKYFNRLCDSVRPEHWDTRPKDPVILQMKANDEAIKSVYRRCAEYAWDRSKLIAYLKELKESGQPGNILAQRLYADIECGELKF